MVLRLRCAVSRLMPFYILFDFASSIPLINQVCRKKIYYTGLWKSPSEEDLLSTWREHWKEKTYRYFTPEDFRLFWDGDHPHARGGAKDYRRNQLPHRRPTVSLLCVYLHVARYSASLNEYRQLVKDLAAGAYVTPLQHLRRADGANVAPTGAPRLRVLTGGEETRKVSADPKPPPVCLALGDIVGRHSSTQRETSVCWLGGPQKNGPSRRVTESMRHVRQKALRRWGSGGGVEG